MFSLDEPITKEKARGMNPVVLAFVGDAVFSLYVRERLTLSHEAKLHEYQRSASALVSAREQSAFLERVLPLLTEEESEIYRRGRNAKKSTKSKNADVIDYNRSTGFEALVGYLYLTGEKARLETLFGYLDEEKFNTVATVKPFKPIN